MSITQSRPRTSVSFDSDLPGTQRLVTTWGSAIALIVAVLILRLAYLAWFCPYELIGDESYYWEQARHLDLCYNEKGPILAWMIAASCRIFGDTEFAVRLPVALASAIAAWGVGKLTLAVTNQNQRIAFFAVLAFILLPAFDANAQICTQDGILIALWVALTAIGLRLFRRMSEKQSTWKEWLVLWVLLGIGVLLKQSALVFLPSLPLCAWFCRKKIGFKSEFLWQPLIGAVIVLIIISPMIIWNSRHGWPMLAHTLGHLGAGGDQAGQVNRGNPITWLSATVGGIVGAFGPGCIILFVLASRRVMKQPDRDSQQWRDRIWLLCAAWPSVIFFLLLSLKKPVVPSWPLPSMVPLVVLLAEVVATEPSKNSLVYGSWKWVIGWGIGGAIFIAFPNILAHQPILRGKAEHALARITGHREAAMELQRTLASVTTPDGKPPLIVTRHYMEAGLYCFYLPGHPTVYTAGKYLGKRSTTFDQWADTNMENPALYGRSLLLDGEGDVKWEQALLFDHREALDGGRFFLVTNYRGPKPGHPEALTEDD